MQKKLTLIILAIAVIATAFWYFGSQSIIKEELPTWPDVSFTEEDYEGWKTFTHDELGYSIRYPSDWVVYDYRDESAGDEVIINPPDAELFTGYISIGIANRTLEDRRRVFTDSDYEIRSKFPDHQPSIETKIMFAGQQAYQFIGRVKEARSIYFQYSNKVYSIITDKDKHPLVKQALASFTFIK